MDTRSPTLVERLNRLGLSCDDVPLDRASSAVTALAAFPMYMVANVHAWTADRQFTLPLVDIPGAEGIREAFALGKQEGRLELSREHRRVIGTLLTSAKPSDRVIYEYALETLAAFLGQAEPAVADAVRAGVARTIVAVARASGEGVFGSGPRVSPEERACIAQIATALRLDASPAAVAALDKLDA